MHKYDDEIDQSFNNYNFHATCLLFKQEDVERELIKINNRRLVKIVSGKDEYICYSMLLFIENIRVVNKNYYLELVNKLNNQRFENKLEQCDFLYFQNSDFVQKNRWMGSYPILQINNNVMD